MPAPHRLRWHPGRGACDRDDAADTYQATRTDALMEFADIPSRTERAEELHAAYDARLAALVE